MASACWASLLGGCAGGITAEHVVSRSLLGGSASVRGMAWCPEFRTIGVAGLTVRCLCKAHNSALSPCDQEARRFGDVLDWMMSDFQPPDASDRVEFLSGHLLTRWFCKTACNVAAVESRTPPLPFVRYAFSAQDDPSVHVYLLKPSSGKVVLDSARYAIEWLQHKSDPSGVFVIFWFRGLAWVIGTRPAEAAGGSLDDLVRASGVEPLEYVGRPSEIGVTKNVAGVGEVAAGRVVVRW